MDRDPVGIIRARRERGFAGFAFSLSTWTSRGSMSSALFRSTREV
jgi:hypothetical protein